MASTLRPSLPSSSPLSRLFLRPLHRTFTTTPRPASAKISIVGRLADVPQMTQTSSGQDVIRYALGTNHGPRENKETSWWKVAAFINDGPFKDSILGLGKGSLIYLGGDCKMRKYQDKEGNERTALNITQRFVEILERRDAYGNRIASMRSQEEG
ncbi:MAG: hypothetical protein Q9208_002814 [Pyrenodesmia sp. 3 TL-2023]